MDDELLILGGIAVLLYLLSSKQGASGAVIIAGPGVSVPGGAGSCVQPGCASAGAGGSPGVASPVAPVQAPAAQVPVVFAPPPGMMMVTGPTSAQIMASNAAGNAYVMPANARQSWQVGATYDPYWYM